MTFLSGFSKRKAIKIATAGIPASDLAAFPKYFEIASDTDIGGETTSQKLAVTTTDGTTQVPYGALYWNVSGGAATLKIRAKFDLSHSWSNGDTIGYLYYDHTATDQSNKSGVLDANTVGYWPLEEDPSGSAPQMKDWSGNYDGTSQGSMTSGDSVTGQVGNGLDFDGSDDHVNLPTISIPTNLTFSCCLYWRGGLGMIVNKQPVNTQWLFFTDGSGVLTLRGGSSADTCNVIGPGANAWHHLAATISGTTGKIYIDGALAVTGTVDALGNGSGIVEFGTYSGSGYPLDGILDETFIANVARSPDWIAYDKTDQFANSSTFTLGAEETSTTSNRRRRILCGAAA